MDSPTKRTAYDWFLEILSFSGLAAAFIPLIPGGRIAAGTPIPKHVNLAGEIDAWGGTGTMWFLALMALGFYVGLLIIEKYPHLYNYPVKITDDNRSSMQRLAVRLIRHVRVWSVLLFGYLNIELFAMAVGWTQGLGWWVVPLAIAAMLIVMIIYARAMIRQTKKIQCTS